MTDELPNCLIPALPNSPDASEPLLESVAGALKLLGRGVGGWDHEVCITAAIVALQELIHTKGSSEALQILQLLALEGLANTASVLKQKSSSSYKVGTCYHDNGHYEDKFNFWESCYKLATADSDETLYPFVATLQEFSRECTHLLTSYVRIASRVFTGREVRQLALNLCGKFWLKEVAQLVKQVGLVEWDSGPMPEQGQVAQLWRKCVQNLSIAHVVLSMCSAVSDCMDTCLAAQGMHAESAVLSICSAVSHCMDTCLAAQGMHAESATTGWACSAVLIPLLQNLANTTPVTLYKVYQDWLNEDQLRIMDTSHVLTASGTQQRQVFPTCTLLSDALTLLVTVAADPHGQVLLKSSTETVLRLGNHYWEQLIQVVKQVPDELPVKTWYLVLSSALHLHSQLNDFQSSLQMTTHQELFCQLLHCIGEFCDGIREQIVAYHTQLCMTSILHDAESHDWESNKAFFENERCSFSVQMWHYHLLGLKHDLWTVCPGEVAVKILASILSATLSHFARRYAAVKPSYKRVVQFRADILAILVTAASLLPFLSPASTENPTTSREVTTIHRGCAILLSALAVVGCDLEQLETSLKAVQLRETPQLNDTPRKWMEFLDMSHFGLQPHSSDAVGDYLAFISLPEPKWELLLKLLLARDCALAVYLCKNAGQNTEAVFHHIALVLAHCYHQPEALSNLLSSLGDSESVARGDDNTQNMTLNWLSQLLKEVLQSHMLSRTDEFCLNLKQNIAIHRKASPDLAGTLSAILDGLERRLGQLPHSVLRVLWEQSGYSKGSVHTVNTRLAKLLGLLVGTWLDVPDSVVDHLREPVLSTLRAYCAVISLMLSGTLAKSHPELDSQFPGLSQTLWKQAPVLQERVERFGSSLEGRPLPQATHSCSSGVSDAEHEIVAEILGSSDEEVQQSLKFLYTLFRTNKDSILQMLQPPIIPTPPSTHVPPITPTPPPTHVPPITFPLPTARGNSTERFNPILACRSLGNGQFDHQWLMEASMNWKGLLEGFALKVLSRGVVVKLVAHRFELQEGAQLQGREPELVASLRSSLHLQVGEEEEEVADVYV